MDNIGERPAHLLTFSSAKPKAQTAQNPSSFPAAVYSPSMPPVFELHPLKAYYSPNQGRRRRPFRAAAAQTMGASANDE